MIGTIQVPACDDCTRGVMDMNNPHRLGTCGCVCHAEERCRFVYSGRRTGGRNGAICGRTRAQHCGFLATDDHECKRSDVHHAFHPPIRGGR